MYLFKKNNSYYYSGNNILHTLVPSLCTNADHSRKFAGIEYGVLSEETSQTLLPRLHGSFITNVICKGMDHYTLHHTQLYHIIVIRMKSPLMINNSKQDAGTDRTGLVTVASDIKYVERRN